MKRVLFAALSLGVLSIALQASSAEARTVGGRNGLHLTGLKAATLETAKLETDCCAPKEPCCSEPCLVYRHCGPKLCCGCEEPKEIVASRVEHGKVVRTRPLCPYPQVATYKGAGSTDDAKNFVCR